MTEDEFAGWRNQEQTKEVINYIKKRISDLESILSSGGTLSDSADTTLKKTAHMVGEIKGLETVAHLNYKDIKEDF